MQKLLADLFQERPADAVSYMIGWLQAEQQRRQEKQAAEAAGGAGGAFGGSSG